MNRNPSEIIAGQIRAEASYIMEFASGEMPSQCRRAAAERLRAIADGIATLPAAEPADAGRGQEPIGYMNRDAEFLLPKPGSCVLSAHIDLVLVRDPHGKFTVPLYTRPPSEAAAVDAAMVDAFAVAEQRVYNEIHDMATPDLYRLAVRKGIEAALASQQAVKP